MLNWAARYFPILRVLKEQLGEVNSLLEVGSGSLGIGKFYRAPFVGCELSFPVHPIPHMLPVLASGTNLPFCDRSFDAVVVSDVLEHVPPVQRMAVVHEALRLTREVAVFGFPSGLKALEYDRKLAQAYDCSRQERPVWLQEHMKYPYPTEALFNDLCREWVVTSFGNESAAFHHWVMLREMNRLWIYFFQVLLAEWPETVEQLLRRADREPYYRRIVVVQRRRTSAELRTY